jgi:hypothetical protein
MPNRKRRAAEAPPNPPGDDELAARAVGDELVDLSRIDREIRRMREEIAASRHELDDLKTGRLSVESLEVLLTDIGDIWANTGQLVGLERQQRDKMRMIEAALEAMRDEVRDMRALLVEHGDEARRAALLRRRGDAEPSAPLAPIDLAPRADEPGPRDGRIEPEDWH